MDIKTLKGIAVVSIDDGARLGAIHDILFDLDNKNVRGFVVSSGGIFGGTSRILDMSDVKSIGVDAVMIASRDLLKADRDDERYKQFPNFHDATSLRVVSQSGALVGDLATIMIDPANGTFTDIQVSKGGLFSSFRSNLVVPATSVIRFGRDVAVIPDEYAPTSDEPHEDVSTEEPVERVETPPTS